MTTRKRTDKKSGSIDYPVSTNYRSEWGQWEAIREIVQNAIDTGGAKVDVNGETTIISDTGNGIGLKQLLIGESTKDGKSSIGKFGEGMKFAFLTLLREGCDLIIHTNGLILNPTLKDMFGENCLTIRYRRATKPIKGTRVKISGLADPRYLITNFLSYDLAKNMAERVLHDRAGQLFIKGIFVKHVSSPVGYNLNMERENPISGAVDMDKVHDRIAHIIERSNDRSFMTKIIRTHLDDDENIEQRVGGHKYWTMKHPVMWKQEAKAVFGTNQICRATNVDMARTAAYKGFEVLIDSAPFFEGFIKEDKEVVPAKRLEEQAVSIDDLDNTARANVRWCRRIIEGAMDEKIKLVKITRFTGDDRTTLGAAKYRSYIKLAPGITRERQTCLETFLHEATHYFYGSSDLTEEFQNDQDRLTAKVVMYMASNKGGSIRKTTPKKEVNHTAIRHLWAAIYLDDCLNDEGTEILGAIDRRLRAVRMMSELYSIAKAFNVKNYSGQTKENVCDLISVAITADSMAELEA